LFVLFVVQIKTFVDSVAQATTETNKNEKQIEIKADYDTLNKTIHIKDVQVKHK